MDILVYGAGIIGSIYAAWLQDVGYNVTLLARGQRAVSVRTHGIQLENASTKQRTTTQVSVVEQLSPTDRYDVVLVTTRLDQLASVLPDLAANQNIPTIVFLLNNPEGKKRFEELGLQRVLLGFPSVGGTREGDVIRYTHAPAFAQTTLEKENGQVTPRLQQLVTAFKRAGFSVALSDHMEDWLKTHALFDLCVLMATIMSHGSIELAHSRKHVLLMLQGFREGARVLQSQGIRIAPFSIQVAFLWLPRWLTATLLQYLLRRVPADILAIDPATQAAFAELYAMKDELMVQFQQSPLPTPTLDYLLTFLQRPGKVLS
jgi:2-dehydropantoate 2-reductase